MFPKVISCCLEHILSFGSEAGGREAEGKPGGQNWPLFPGLSSPFHVLPSQSLHNSHIKGRQGSGKTRIIKKRVNKDFKFLCWYSSCAAGSMESFFPVPFHLQLHDGFFVAGIGKGHSRTWNFISGAFSWAGNGHLIQKDPQNVLPKLHRCQIPVLLEEWDIPKSFPTFLPTRLRKIRKESQGNIETSFSWRKYPSPSSVPASHRIQGDPSRLAFQRKNLGQMHGSPCKALVGETFGILFKDSPPFPIFFPLKFVQSLLFNKNFMLLISVILMNVTGTNMKNKVLIHN